MTTVPAIIRYERTVANLFHPLPFIFSIRPERFR